MKKSIAFSVSILMGLTAVISGCSATTQPTQSSSSTSAPPKEAQKTENVTVFKIGYVNAQDSTVDKGARKFAEILQNGTNGKVKVELYPNSQLGGERPMLENMKVGAIDMVITGDAGFAMFAPEYSGLSTPYLFRDIDHLHKVLYGPIGEDINKVFQKNLNSTVLDWWDRGARNLTANKPIKTPDDLKGFKIRVPEIPNIVDSWRALGANPTPMSFDQVFNALQQKVIDGQENPLDLIYTSKFYEVQKYVMMTEHLIAPFIFLVNNDKLHQLPEDIQKKVKDAAVEAGKYEKELTQTEDKGYIQKLKDAGVTVVEVDKSLFAKKLEEAKVDEKYADKWAPNLIQRIRDTK